MFISSLAGPDIEFIEEILYQVGGRHAKMQVSVFFFPFLGSALTWALKENLGGAFTDEHMEAWEEVYEAISEEIIKAIVNSSSA